MADLILMPRLDDTVTGGVITEWHKNIGNSVKRGDLIAGIETSKAIMELESYKAGFLLYIGASKGERIGVNGLICIIGELGEDISKFVGDFSNVVPKTSKAQTPALAIEEDLAPPIFFSYSRNDSEFALRLVNDIRGSDQKVWMDISDVRVGQPWHKEIQIALEKARSILVVLSKSSVNSDHVLDEIFYGLNKRKNIIPIMINDCDPPYGLHRLHYIDFRTSYNAPLKLLLETIVEYN